MKICNKKKKRNLTHLGTRPMHQSTEYALLRSDGGSQGIYPGESELGLLCC